LAGPKVGLTIFVVMRLGYIDVARGVAVLLMIEIHCFNSWVALAQRDTELYRWAQHLGGFAAPGFLLLAGVGLGFKLASEVGRGTKLAQACRAAARRGGWILLLAYVFRFQEWLLAGARGPIIQLLKVDVLNCIGASLILVALLGLGPERSAVELRDGRPTLRWPRRAVAWAALMALLTPLTSRLPFPAGTWQALTGYLGGELRWTTFPLFPWAAYAFAGLALGVVWRSAFAAGPAKVGRSVLKVASFGLLLAIAGRWIHEWLVPYVGDASDANHGWTAPARFGYRLGACLAVTAGLYLFERFELTGGGWWELLRRMGQASLLIYWVHVDLVYGQLSSSIRQALTIPQASWRLAVLLAAMAALAWARTSGYLKWPAGWNSALRRRRLARSGTVDRP
jgi:uncharacterized membrane protein